MKLQDVLRNRFLYLGIGFLLFLVIALGFQRYKSQSEFAPIHIDETKTIFLEKSSDARQLTIFENDRVIISIGYDQYIGYAKSDGKLPMFSHIVESRSDEIEAFFEEGIIPEDFSAQSYLIIEMLNSGKASIYDKQAERELTSIVERFQNDIWCPVCGGGSINFYFPDGTLLYKGSKWHF